MNVSDNVQIVQTVINGCVGMMTIVVGVIAIIIYRGQLDEMRKTTEAAN